MKTVGEDAVVRGVEPTLGGGAAKVETCPNCGSEHVESYCAACGQRAGSLHTPISAFLHDALDGLISFDSRIWRTLVALLRHPGSLTVDYWEGRRARFVAPLRLYLFVSFFAFLFSLSVDPPSIRAGLDPGETIDGLVAGASAPERWLVQNVVVPLMEDPERVLMLFVRGLPWTIFALVPLFAAWLRMLYRRRERFFVPHLVFALHFHTLAFLLWTAAVAGDLIFRTDVVSDLSLLAIVAMLFLSLRRAYAEGRLKTTGKQVTLLLVHTLAVGIGVFGLLIIASLAA